MLENTNYQKIKEQYFEELPDIADWSREMAETVGLVDDWLVAKKVKQAQFNQLIKKRSKSKFTVQDERSWAIKTLQPLSGLSDTERKRVLKRAVKMIEA